MDFIKVSSGKMLARRRVYRRRGDASDPPGVTVAPTHASAWWPWWPTTATHPNKARASPEEISEDHWWTEHERGREPRHSRSQW